MLYSDNYRFSARAEIITRRSYNRPLDSGGFETWPQTVGRAIEHQRWLWERVAGRSLAEKEVAELRELGNLMLSRKALLAGRTLWLGGTDIAKIREASQFNCSFSIIKTVYDVVDAFWLLLQGCGVGFRPYSGLLTGFLYPVELEVVRSTATEKTGEDSNVETFDSGTGVWVIRVGDSAEAWAKAIGKLLIHKFPAKKLVLDFRSIRPGGVRLKGYGWISSGDVSIAKAFSSIAAILNRKAGELLSAIDILDVLNWLGTTLSSRRSAENAIFDYGSSEWRDFALAKKDMYARGFGHREQSNNSLIFWERPTLRELNDFFELKMEAGGGDPGIVNGRAAKVRAAWFEGFNPCFEIILPDKGFCNLVEIDLWKFVGDIYSLKRAVQVMARANYRQTCVNLRDGILQESWHANNQFLRLCGVGLTGVVRSDLTPNGYIQLNRVATHAAYGMADELGLPRPKNVTTVKPSGTISKVMDTTEGMHRPVGRYIFNNVKFSKHDETVPVLVDAGYRVVRNPGDSESVLAAIPVSFPDVAFNTLGEDGAYYNKESAVDQLNRYLSLMETWCQQNVSCTIEYGPDEISSIVSKLDKDWDRFVSTTFLPRQEVGKTAADLGYDYLPQEIVSKEEYESYVKGLKPVSLDSVSGFSDSEPQEDCAAGACPVR